jgi:hypothetical protein
VSGSNVPEAMGWTPPPDNGIDLPKWKCHPPLEPEGEVGTGLPSFQQAAAQRRNSADQPASLAQVGCNEWLGSMPTSTKFRNDVANCGFLLVAVDAFHWAAADICVGQEVPNVPCKLNAQTSDLILKLLCLTEPQLKVVF